VLIVVPQLRPVFFPPTKLAVVHPHEGGNAPAPPAGDEEHSGDTLTGAPEAQKGEAAEQEASNFVSGIALVAVGAASGTGEDDSPSTSTYLWFDVRHVHARVPGGGPLMLIFLLRQQVRARSHAITATTSPGRSQTRQSSLRRQHRRWAQLRPGASSARRRTRQSSRWPMLRGSIVRRECRPSICYVTRGSDLESEALFLFLK
jgi:hypothetical protein